MGKMRIRQADLTIPVRNPFSTGYIPKEGMVVDKITYWERRINAGEVVEIDDEGNVIRGKEVKRPTPTENHSHQPRSNKKKKRKK